MTAASTVRVLDPDLTAVERLTHRGELARVLDALPWLDGPVGARAAVRLRWKPGSSVRLGAVVPTAAGPVAVLVAAFAPGSTGKADKIVAQAARGGAPVHRDGEVVAVPAWTDPRLHRLLPRGAGALSYNPARRWVGRTGSGVLKVHAQAPPPGVAALIGAPPAALAEHLVAGRVDRDGRRVRSPWMPGAPPRPGDGDAVAAALAALHAAPPPAGLPVLDAGVAVRAAHAAACAVVDVLPAERARVLRLLTVLGECAHRWPEPTVLVHGDFSPDQVLVHDGRAVLLDLDRAATGPADWDWAQWTVSQIAEGGLELPAPAPVHPLSALTAALLRAPEPFRRLRPDWPGGVAAVLDHADAAATQLRSRS